MRQILSLFVIVFLIVVGVVIVYFKQSKIQPEPKRMIPKYSFGKKGERLGTFISPALLAIKDKFLWVMDVGFSEDSLGLLHIGNQRIQVLEIKPNGTLSPKFTFGKRGQNLGEFDMPSGIGIKGDFLYISDSKNRIQCLEIKY